MHLPTRAPLLLCILANLTLFTAGCIPRPKDLSGEPRIRELGLIGRCLVLAGDEPLYQVGKPYPRLVIHGGISVDTSRPPARQVAIVRAGTPLRIVKVEHAVYYDDGMFWIEGDFALGRIETGEFAGKVVDIGWGGLALPAAGTTYPPYVPCPATR